VSPSHFQQRQTLVQSGATVEDRFTELRESVVGHTASGGTLTTTTEERSRRLEVDISHVMRPLIGFFRHSSSQLPKRNCDNTTL